MRPTELATASAVHGAGSPGDPMSTAHRTVRRATSRATNASSPLPTSSPPAVATRLTFVDRGGASIVATIAIVAGSMARTEPVTDPEISRPSAPNATVAASVPAVGVIAPTSAASAVWTSAMAPSSPATATYPPSALMASPRAVVGRSSGPRTGRPVRTSCTASVGAGGELTAATYRPSALTRTSDGVAPSAPANRGSSEPVSRSSTCRAPQRRRPRPLTRRGARPRWRAAGRPGGGCSP